MTHLKHTFACVALVNMLVGACTTRTDRGTEAVADQDVSTEGYVRLYVVDRYEGVRRVDLHTLAVIDSIDTGLRPHGLVASPDGRTLYITVETTNEVIKVDVATHEIIGRVEVGPRPNEPTLSQDGRYLFIPLRAGEGGTSVVETETMTHVKTLPTGLEGHNAYTSADGALVYSTSMGEDLIAVIDPTELEIVRKIHVGGIPRPVALTNDGALAYVALSGLTGYVSIDLSTDEVIHRVELPIPPGTPPPLLDTYTHGLLLTPNQHELWLAGYGTEKVYAFSVPEHEQFAEIQMDGGPHWFTLHPDGEPLYVSLERGGKVAAIHRGLAEVMYEADVGEAPTRLLAFRTPIADGHSK